MKRHKSFAGAKLAANNAFMTDNENVDGTNEN